MDNMKCIFPSSKYYEYKTFFEEEKKINELLSMRLTKDNTIIKKSLNEIRKKDYGIKRNNQSNKQKENIS